MTILPFPSRDEESAPDTPSSGAELVVVPEHPHRGRLRGWLERQPPLPSSVHIAQRVHWWRTDGLKKIGALVLRSPVLLFCEAVPVGRGLSRILGVYARWVMVADYDDTISAAKGNTRTNHAAKVRKYRSNNRRLSAIAFVVLGGTSWWGIEEHPGYMILTGIGIACICDVVGRRGNTKTQNIVVMPRSVISEGVSLSSLRTQLQQELEAEGFDPEKLVIDMPMPVRNGWRVPYHSRQAIDDPHLRVLEQALQIRRNGITQLREPSNAARGELWITIKDPLAELIPSPDLPEQSIYTPLPLGKNANGGDWEELFLRTHFSVTGASQSGKSSLFWQIIYVLRRCHEVELDAIDFTDGPCFSACHRAFRRSTIDESGELDEAKILHEATQILNDGIALIKKRAAELSRLARADDTPDKYDEKHAPTREHPQRIILIDEGARVTEKPDLLPLVEYILRYGAKTAVTLGLASQGGQLPDTGSSIVRSMMMLKIMLACSRQDVLSVFGKDARDEGFRPDLLEAAQGSNVRDAGKAFVQSATSGTPEMRRAYRLEQDEVRRRDRELGSRVYATGADGTVDDTVIEAQEVPTILVDMEEAFADSGNPEALATASLLEWLNDHGYDLDANKLADDGKKLAELVKPFGLKPDIRSRRLIPGAGTLRGYYLADLRKALGRFGG